MDLLEHLQIIEQADPAPKRKNKTQTKQNNRHHILCHHSKRTRPRIHRSLRRTPTTTTNNIHPKTRRTITRHHQTSLHHTQPHVPTKIPTPHQRTLKQQRKRKTAKNLCHRRQNPKRQPKQNPQTKPHRQRKR
jgi:hypothetical protein